MTADHHVPPGQVYAVYVLTPDRRFRRYAKDIHTARSVARELVDNGYRHAEVWDDKQPIFAVWRTETNRIEEGERES